LQSMTIQGEISVFDGDTLEIEPMLIRLHGVDAPEKSQSCKRAGQGAWRCGSAASKRLSELIHEKEVSCEALDRDPYGWIVSRCAVDGQDIGTVLINEGLAWAFIEYSSDYVALDEVVRARGVGVWQEASQTPWDYRNDKWNRALAQAPDGKCPIKGNIGAGKAKRKIYHTPWSPNYGNTKIDVTQGERWFCDEGEALAAGWSAVAKR
ncbi:MAG: thermonuclease family protein, partial [Paracoccaceae bacterium]